MQTNSSEYNGWTNYETWNVSLWLHGDECCYTEAKRMSKFVPENNKAQWAKNICENIFYEQTPDGVKINDDKINWEEIASALEEI